MGLAGLAKGLTGSFDSSLQADQDDSYYDISLRATEIWTERPGTWLYVEQALSETADKPYRQRVYELRQRGRRYESRVYELPEPEAYVGGYANADRFAGLRPEQLRLREGCTVYLREKEPGYYVGETKKDRCKSSLRGASYATSRVVVGDGFVQSWDRGYDADGEQVWGAVDGGYMFFRQ